MTTTQIVKFTDDAGKLVEFSAQDVVNFVCATATQQEVVLFLAHCAKHNLDPIGAKDAYLIKYGNSPAQIITGFQVFNRRANKAPNYGGIEDGVVVFSQERGLEHRPGSAVYPELGEKLVGGWARVHFTDGKIPAYAEVSLSDFSTGKSNWAKMPGVMIDKVAKATAWRLAYPDEFSGMYINDEMQQAQPNAQSRSQPVQAAVEPVPPTTKAAPQTTAQSRDDHQDAKDFMRAMSREYARICNISPNEAAHIILDSCGDFEPTERYMQRVQDFVLAAGQSAAPDPTLDDLGLYESDVEWEDA